MSGLFVSIALACWAGPVAGVSQQQSQQHEPRAENARPTHWSFVPPRRAAPPAVTDAGSGANPIDAFVLARLEGAGLRPSPPADRETLIRRVTLTLTGLPPSLAEIDAFGADRAPFAFERVVDRLLASPRYGEHQAARWLDLARYADTNGYEKDRPRELWLWRDWVIDAFNEDLPYDRFTIEQIAGDLLPDAGVQQRIATGFQRNSMLNDEGGIDPEEFRVVAVKDRVHTTATVWLGLTMDCAQCHSHKFDPTSIEEYYSFYAFFDHTEDVGVGNGPFVGVPEPERREEFERLGAELAGLRAEYEADGPEFQRAFWAWREALAARVAEETRNAPRLGVWHALGPIVTGDAKTAHARAFPPERGVDLGRTHYGLGWREHPEWQDGAVHPLSGEGAANYLYRTVDSPIEQTVTLSLGSDDSLKVFLNGQELFAKEITRGAAPDQDRVGTALRKGRNELLLKVVNGGGPTGFCFRLVLGDEPEAVRTILARPETARTPAQRRELAAYYRSIAPELAGLRRKIATVEARLAVIPQRQTMVMKELPERRDTRVLLRGSFLQPGEPVTPGVPAFLHPFPDGAPRDRLGLARWIVSADNPLFARVAVNRLWQSCFGDGLVRTPEDFGTQGDPPTHPELLDWLATEFVRDGLSPKRMLRRIVTSATFRQSSCGSSELTARDPGNALCARGPRHRLRFEEIRDLALAAAGLLHGEIGGPSVMPPQPPGVWENSFGIHDLDDRWVEAQDAERYRRGMYVYLRRTAPYPSHAIFDGPSREVCVARRARTDTPLQALTTLNDPAFVECAGGLAARAMREAGPEPAARAVHMFRLCTSRRPAPDEIAELTGLYARALGRYEAAPADAAALLAHVRVTPAELPAAELAAWTVVANTALNLDEALTLR